MKYVVIVIIFITTLNAEYLLKYYGNNYCIDSYSIQDSSSNIDIVLSSNGQTYTISTDISNIIPGYEYNASANTCNKKEILQKLGLDYYQYNFIFAFLGLLIGVIFLAGVILG